MYTTWFQNPIHLPHGSISINNVSETITHRNSIKFTVIKWQISSITFNPPMIEYILTSFSPRDVTSPSTKHECYH